MGLHRLPRLQEIAPEVLSTIVACARLASAFDTTFDLENLCVAMRDALGGPIPNHAVVHEVAAALARGGRPDRRWVRPGCDGCQSGQRQSSVDCATPSSREVHGRGELGPAEVAALQFLDLEAGVSDQPVDRPVEVASTGDPLLGAVAPVLLPGDAGIRAQATS